MANPIPTRTIPPFVRSVDSSFPHTTTNGPEQPAPVLPVSRWVSYMHSSGAPRRHLTPEQRNIADSIWTAYDEKRAAADEESLLNTTSSVRKELERRRRSLIQKTMRFCMRNPFAPLFFRIFILFDSVIALALAADIKAHRKSCLDNGTHILAIVVNTIAIPYTIYIAWDEFFSKPIGLRRSRSKLRLLTLDLVFIVFESANLSLAFDAAELDCGEQWGLVVVLLVTLVSWFLTFLLSLFRLMYKMEGRPNQR